MTGDLAFTKSVPYIDLSITDGAAMAKPSNYGIVC